VGRQSYENARAGVRKLATETGAGQWGSALAFPCTLFGLECEVFMVGSSYDQKPYRRSIPGQNLPVFDGRGRVSQWDQAKALGNLANDRMARLAAQAGTESGKAANIRFALPDQGRLGDVHRMAALVR
jgi:hypothetical protein